MSKEIKINDKVYKLGNLKEVLAILKEKNAEDIINGIETDFRKLEVLTDDGLIVPLFRKITKDKETDFALWSIQEREELLTAFLSVYGLDSLNIEANKAKRIVTEIAAKAFV